MSDTYDPQGFPAGIRAFLAALAVQPNFSRAARAAAAAMRPGGEDIAVERLAQAIRRQHQYLQRDNPEYREAAEAAYALGVTSMEDHACERAMEGWDEPVYQGGMLVGVKRKHSDRVLLRFLETKRPETWGKRKLEVSNSQRGITSLSDDELEHIARSGVAAFERIARALENFGSGPRGLGDGPEVVPGDGRDKPQAETL